MKKPGRKPLLPVSERPGWARRISEARSAKGFSQAALAERVGLSQSTLADYETGRTYLGYDVGTRIADALDVSASWIFEGNVIRNGEKSRRADPAKDPPVETYITDSTLFQSEYDKFVDIFVAQLKNSGADKYVEGRLLLKLGRTYWMSVLALADDRPLSERVDIIGRQLLYYLRDLVNAIEAADELRPDITDNSD